MKPETKKEIKDTVNTLLLCGVSIAVVVHLHGLFNKDTENTNDTKTAKYEIKTDSVKTDTVPMANFVSEQIKHQKTR